MHTFIGYIDTADRFCHNITIPNRNLLIFKILFCNFFHPDWISDLKHIHTSDKPQSFNIDLISLSLQFVKIYFSYLFFLASVSQTRHLSACCFQHLVYVVHSFFSNGVTKHHIQELFGLITDVTKFWIMSMYWKAAFITGQLYTYTPLIVSLA